MSSRIRDRLPRPLLLLLALCSSAAAASSERVDGDGVNPAGEDAAAVVDQLTAWSQCSLGDKAWSVCLQPTGWGPLWYCPTIEESADPVRGDSTPLEDIHWYGIQTNFLPCFACPAPGAPYGDDCDATLAALAEIHDLGEESALGGYDVTGDGLSYCKELCEGGETGDACSSEDKCTAGSHFCSYDDGDFDPESSGLAAAEGKCRECPADVNDCLDLAASPRSRRECFYCRLGCFDVGVSTVTVDGETLFSSPIGQATQEEATMSAEGGIVDCSDLILHDTETCSGAKGKVCLVEDYTLDTVYPAMSQKAENNGCIAIIMFTQGEVAAGASHSYDYLRIPFVVVSLEDGTRLRKMASGDSVAKIETTTLGSACYPSWNANFCTDTIECQEEGTYCDFKAVFRNDEYVEGLCEYCPTTGERGQGDPDPAGCFFERDKTTSLRLQKEVESCARTCSAGADIAFEKNCKFCPDGISAFEFGVDNKADKCRFCPENDIIHPDRHVPLFGDNITCWNMQAFFERLEVHKDSDNCVLAQNFNYICGCAGSGYAGANTSAKRNALIWVPRIMAILSGLGSLFVLFDILRVNTRRAKFFNQLMIQMSVFDIIGSVAYAFTSLPIPSEYYFDGAHGSQATCTAQGFFLQIGTIACFTNVSLAFYYFFVIQKGWSEMRLKKVRLWFFLCPIITGMAFAFAGIPFYDNMMLWCNNAAAWWPDIPVAIAILTSTFLMGSVCWDVYKKHRASMRWNQGPSASSGPSLSNQVLWQSFWYLMAFYMTWPPYLALQYLWASGRGYGNYGFILYAGTVVPLQGCWNCFVYVRNRQLKHFRERASALVSSMGRRSANMFSRYLGTEQTNEESKPSTEQGNEKSKLSAEQDIEEKKSSATQEVTSVSQNPPTKVLNNPASA